MEPPLSKKRKHSDDDVLVADDTVIHDTVQNKIEEEEEASVSDPTTTTTIMQAGGTTPTLMLYQESILVTTVPPTTIQAEQFHATTAVVAAPQNNNNNKSNPWESIRSKLVPTDDASYTQEALETVLDLCHKIHSIHSTEYTMLVATIVPIFPLILKSVPCVAPLRRVIVPDTPLSDSETTTTSTTGWVEDPWSLPLSLSPEDTLLSNSKEEDDPVEYQLRHAILTLCTKLPPNDILRPYASILLLLSMDILLKDYEDNGILALKLIFDLHRTFRNILVEHVPPFLDFCIQGYKNVVGMTREKTTNHREGYDTWMQLWCPFVSTMMTTTKTVESDKEMQSSLTPGVHLYQGEGLEKEMEVSHPEDGTMTIMDPNTTTTSSSSSMLLQSPTKSLVSDPMMMVDSLIPMTVADPLKSPLMEIANSTASASQVQDMDMSTSHALYYVPPKAVNSYRVLAECPLTIMLLFQLYPKSIKNYLPQLLPFMMETLFQRPPTYPMIPKSISSSVSTTVIHGSTVSSSQDFQHPLDGSLTQKIFQTRSRELLSVQVKTLSFVTYLLKGFSDKLKPYEERLAASVMNILSMIPRDALMIRREALVCLGHVFATDYRKGFLRHVDFLLDERILLGSSRQQQGEASYMDVRPIAFRALADFLHHVRTKLTMTQVSKVVQLYSKILHDVMMNMSISMKALSIRMLLNMVDHAFQNKEGKASLGRDIMFRILEASVNMLGTVVANGLDRYIMPHSSMDESTIRVHRDEKRSFSVVSPTASDVEDPNLDQVRDLVRPIIVGSKNIFFCINNYGNQREKNRKDIISGLSAMSGHSDDAENKQRSGYDDSSLQKFTLSEQELIGKFFEWGLRALPLFKIATEDPSLRAETRSSSKKEYLSEYEYFAASLVVLEGHYFHRVVGSRVQILLDRIMEDDAFMSIPKYLLSKNSNSSRDLAVCIIPRLLCRSPYLVTRTCDILDLNDRKDEARRSEVMFHIFETFFSSLALFPKNEAVLRPFIQVIVSECIRYATADYPNVSAHNLRHLSILRSMFRAISGGKFEESYKEILPILPTLLNGLYRIYVVSRNVQLRFSILELSLSIPARLSCLLPHLPLLLRFIIPAINTGVAEITNLALRTLEFWVDNLNIDFLYPILSHDSSLLAELMASLGGHLQPAPYQFGLLTLRLLGKLGGKSRCFLQEPMDLQHSAFSDAYPEGARGEIFKCRLGQFEYPLPIELAVSILKSIPANQRTFKELSACRVKFNDRESVKNFLQQIHLEAFDLDVYNADVSGDVIRRVVMSAFDILRSGLSSIVQVDSADIEAFTNLADPDICLLGDIDNSHNNKMLSSILDGLMHATLFGYLKTRATLILDGFLAYIILVCVKYRRNIHGTDASGEQIPSHDISDTSNGIAFEFRPFGCLQVDGPLSRTFNILIMNDLFARVLSEGADEACQSALLMVGEIKSLFYKMSCHLNSENSHGAIDEEETSRNRDVRIIYENLLYKLCLETLSVSRVERFWLHEGIFKVMVVMGKDWSLQFEAHLLQVALYSINHSINEVSRPGRDSLIFFIRICCFLHGTPIQMQGKIIQDDFDIPDDRPTGDNPSNTSEEDVILDHSSSASILIQQLSSVNSTVRFAARHGLRHLYGGSSDEIGGVLQKNTSILKKNIFSRSLRNLSLPEQVASIESFLFVVLKAPKIFPLSDNLVLAYLLDLLKMLGVADKEMTSESVSAALISDKDGYCPTDERNDNMIDSNAYLTHSSQIFLHNEIILDDINFDFRVLVPRQLPHGIQLRLSSLGLFNALIKSHSDEFFSAPSASALANIRPHVISLFFRSLTSRPAQCAVAAHNALRDILLLSSKTDGSPNDSQGNSNRLSKDLLQTCIRPILVNIRDHTKLSLPLLRGIARLLSLLSSWFSKTLGEKLLDHLQYWSDSEKIIKQCLCKEGDEPLVAAGILEMFQLLPDSSHFVEPLVKTTIKLEAVIPQYKANIAASSPFRVPLAQYLNKYGAALAHFFINEHRLKNPVYSDLIQDIIGRPECADLRAYLSGSECTQTILTVCFDRPLAIIRSEKATSASNKASEVLRLHGINLVDYSIQISSREPHLRQELERKQEKLVVAELEEKKLREVLSKLLPGASDYTEKYVAQSRRQHQRALIAVEEARKEVVEVQELLTQNTDRSSSSQASNQGRSMTTDHLELQLQGFIMVETLMAADNEYLKTHNEMTRAFRWLWRSKGRHLRLLHEDSIPPRYTGESMFLARYLVHYAKLNVDDVDLLFDLLRIFLHSSAKDFSFVKTFITDTVSTVLDFDHRNKVMQRFLALLNNADGSEETKLLAIQLIILPMFDSAVHRAKNSVGELPENSSSFIDKKMFSLLCDQALSRPRYTKQYGQKLTVELLKLSGILLDIMPQDLTEHKALVAFAWNYVRTDDIWSKPWAILTICKYMDTFDTPEDIVLKLYAALLRSNQEEGRDLINSALNIFISAVPKRLSRSECMTKISTVTASLMYECNTVQHLAYTMNILLQYEKIFRNDLRTFVPHIVSSLNKIALPLTSTAENMALSIALVELLLTWDDLCAQKSVEMKPDDDGENIFVTSSDGSHDTVPRVLGKSQVDAVTNFIVRFLLSMSNVDSTNKTTIERARACFRRLLHRWPTTDIRYVYFDKIVSLCSNHSYLEVLAPPESENQSGKKTLDKSFLPSDDVKNSPSGKAYSSKDIATEHFLPAKLDQPKSLSIPLISACIDVFLAMIECSPPHTFLTIYARKLKDCMKPFFSHALSSGGKEVLIKLKLFLMKIVIARRNSSAFQPFLDTVHILVESSFSSTSAQLKLTKSTHEINSTDASAADATFHLLSALDYLGAEIPGFPDVYTYSIINVFEILLSEHLTTSTLSRSSASAGNYPAVSPTIAIIEEAMRDCPLSTDNFIKRQQQGASQEQRIEVTDDNRGIRVVKCLICCIRIVGKSNVLYRFSEPRAKFLVMLMKILEKADDMSLLVSVCKEIALILSRERSDQLFTQEEKKMLVARIKTLYHKSFADTKSHMLFHLISFIVMEQGKFVESDQALAGSLMTTNLDQRSLAAAKILSDMKVDLSAPVEVDLLRCTQFFAQDFEAIGNRFIPFAIVELMSTCLRMKRPNEYDSCKLFPCASDCDWPNTLTDKNSFLKSLHYFTELLSCKHEETTDAIQFLLSSSTELCQDFLERIIQKSWMKAEIKSRSELVLSVLRLMSQKYHSQFLRRPPSYTTEKELLSRKYYRLNSVWSFASILSKLDPVPSVDSIILFPIASTYNCFHEIKSILERQTFESEVNDTKDKRIDELNAGIVRQLYLELGEKDIWLYLKSLRCLYQGSRLAVSYDYYGKVEAALDTYNDLMESAQKDFEKMQGDQSRNLDTDVSLWEDRWIALNRELIQWPLLTEIAENSNLTRLGTECAWKCRDFDKLRSICTSVSGIAALENGDIEQKMSEIFLAVTDGSSKIGDIENLHAQTNQLCLYKWQLLPEIYASCQAHSHLLHQFHRLIEIRESGQLISDISSHASARTIPESPKTLMNVWRNRLPCDFDSVTWWDDIFQWRNHLFHIISNNFSWAEQATLATLHDRPWTAIRIARLARKHGIKDVALFSLAQLTDCAMDVNDAYSKLREQILTYKDGTEIERTCGLNLINTTNLSYFDSTQKSELFRLKAEFLDGLGSRSKATNAYCNSVQICPSSSRSWCSWGDLCWQLYRLLEKQDQETTETKDSKDSSSSNIKQGIQYMAQAMGCYLEAVHCDACESARLNLPKCLVMLSKDLSPNGLLCQTFEKYSSELPPWVFLIWTPQILSGLCRMEGRAMKSLLSKILLSYPQAIYFPLRAFYLERRDAERSRINPEGQQHESVTHADELMAAFRKAHPTLWTSLETILEELILRFRPSHEEELLATMTALLQRAEYQLEHQRRPGENDDGAIRASFKKTLSRISSKFFETSSSDGKNNPKDERLRKIKAFIDRYKALFDADFMDYDTGENFRLQLPDINSKLQKWKMLLEKQVAMTPPSVPLVTVSQTLSTYCSSAPDLWPGSCDPTSIPPGGRNQDEISADSTMSSSTSAKVAAAMARNACRSLSAASRFEGSGGLSGLGSAVVEVPGQYSPNRAYDTKPAPELHIKLVRFEGNIQVIFRNGQLARKIGLVGSDGKVYVFLLQFAVPYWTKTDERTAQIHNIFGSLLRRDKNACRRSLWLKPCPAIPIAQRLRMMFEDKSHVSLEEIYVSMMQRKGIDPSTIAHLFQSEVRTRLEPSSDHPVDEEMARSAKLHAFQEVCRQVDDHILSDFIHRVFFSDAESLFKFRKVFTNQLAMNSLLQYVFDANDRNPSRFMFSVKTGQVLAPDFRFSYSNQGFLDGRCAVPFRLTRNLETLLGPTFIQGVFVPALCSAASAIYAAESRLESVFQLLIRDDIVSWYMSKASQREGTQKPMEELERQLADRVVKNTILVLNRIRDCTPRESRSEAHKGRPLDDRVRMLVKIATTESNLAEMPVGYHAWL